MLILGRKIAKMERAELIEKAKEFYARKTKLTLERYERISEEWNETSDKRERGEITKEECDKIHRELIKETQGAEIEFDNEKDFREFTNILIEYGAFASKSISEVLPSVEHEIEHSGPWEKAGVKSYFGWHNFSEPNMLKAYHKASGDKHDALSPQIGCLAARPTRPTQLWRT